ncbi:MAG: tryptophan-rich sensory protein [Bacteroidetes bacterium]|nr:tryptophan-rich sensory protein [Bacteroidota bacterium]
MNYWAKLIIFLVLNFGALAIGSYFTGNGITSSWYQNLQKAPWSPPGFVFGIAWFTIMICFSFFMANITTGNKLISINILLIIYAAQWLLNVLWNPLFFKFQLPHIALIDIILLFMVVGIFLFLGFKQSLANGLLVLPYFIWLAIAVSLNAYIVVKN